MAQGLQDPVVAAFVARLREFHTACGTPTYRSLVDVSSRLAELYPDQVRERDLPRLSVSAISEVLGGRRVGLPSARWVVSFVLACQRRAFETFVLSTDPGLAVVPTWIARLQQARTPLIPTSSAFGGPPAADVCPDPRGLTETAAEAMAALVRVLRGQDEDTRARPAAAAEPALPPVADPPASSARQGDGGVLC